MSRDLRAGIVANSTLSSECVSIDELMLLQKPNPRIIGQLSKKPKQNNMFVYLTNIFNEASAARDWLTHVERECTECFVRGAVCSVCHTGHLFWFFDNARECQHCRRLSHKTCSIGNCDCIEK